jgi:hypothetical protein
MNRLVLVDSLSSKMRIDGTGHHLLNGGGTVNQFVLEKEYTGVCVSNHLL